MARWRQERARGPGQGPGQRQGHMHHQINQLAPVLAQGWQGKGGPEIEGQPGGAGRGQGRERERAGGQT